MSLVNKTAQWKALEEHWKQMSQVHMSLGREQRHALCRVELDADRL